MFRAILAFVAVLGAGCSKTAGVVALQVSENPGQIVVDGVDGEPAWSSVPWSKAFVAPKGQRGAPGTTRAKLTWNKEGLYLYVEVIDPDLVSASSKGGIAGDHITLLIDADRSGGGFARLDAGMRKTRFDTWFPHGMEHQSDPRWQSGFDPESTFDGTINKGKDRDKRWRLEMGVPWSAVTGPEEDAPFPEPPKHREVWHINVIRHDVDSKGKRSRSSWKQLSENPDPVKNGDMLLLRFAAAGAPPL